MKVGLHLPTAIFDLVFSHCRGHSESALKLNFYYPKISNSQSYAMHRVLYEQTKQQAAIEICCLFIFLIFEVSMENWPSIELDIDESLLFSIALRGV